MLSLSSDVSVAASPVHPAGTMPAVPLSACIRSSARSELSSSSPSFIGVTVATIEPVNIDPPGHVRGSQSSDCSSDPS